MLITNMKSVLKIWNGLRAIASGNFAFFANMIFFVNAIFMFQLIEIEYFYISSIRHYINEVL